MDLKTRLWWIILHIGIPVAVVLTMVFILNLNGYTRGNVGGVNREYHVTTSVSPTTTPTTTLFCRDVDVPYTEIETYVETVPYIQKSYQSVPFKYSVDSRPLLTKIDGTSIISLDLKNLDVDKGTFNVTCTCGTRQGNLTDTYTIYLYPQQTRSVYAEFPVKCSGSWYRVSPPVNIVEHEVTHYRDVRREREVTLHSVERQCS